MTRRLTVRATVENKDGAFKPEMFANVTIYRAAMNRRSRYQSRR